MNQRIYRALPDMIDSSHGKVPGFISASGVVYWNSSRGWRKMAEGRASRTMQKPKVEGKIDLSKEFVAKQIEAEAQEDVKRSWFKRGLEAVFVNKQPRR